MMWLDGFAMNDRRIVQGTLEELESWPGVVWRESTEEERREWERLLRDHGEAGA